MTRAKGEGTGRGFAEAEGEAFGQAKRIAMTTLESHFPGITAEHVRFTVVGDPDGVPARVRGEVDVSAWRNATAADRIREPAGTAVFRRRPHPHGGAGRRPNSQSQQARRRYTAVAVIALTASGGAAGADPGKPGGNATVLLALDPAWPALLNDPGRVTARLRYIQGFARMPEVLVAAEGAPEVLAASGKETPLKGEGVAARTDVQRGSTPLSVSARGSTAPIAEGLASSLASEIAYAAQRALRSLGPRGETLGDFEAGVGGWTPLASDLPSPPQASPRTAVGHVREPAC